MAEQQVQLTDLDPAQLQDVKKQLDQELDHLTTSYSQLKQAQAKFKACLSDIGELTSSAKGKRSFLSMLWPSEDAAGIKRYERKLTSVRIGKEVLVPLTSSLYVPGKLTDLESVVVDVGTGYYVKKTKTEALSHYTSKTSFVQGNLDTLQKTIERKQDNVQSVVGVLQLKMRQQSQGTAQAAK